MWPEKLNGRIKRVAQKSSSAATTGFKSLLWVLAFGIPSLAAFVASWPNAPHIWQRKVFRIYHGDSDDVEVRLSETTPFVFALKSAYPGEVPTGSPLGDECQWLIDQPSSPHTSAFRVPGRECDIDSQRMTENVREFMTRNNLEPDKPFRVTVKATDQSNRPLLSARDSSGNGDIPPIIIIVPELPGPAERANTPPAAAMPLASKTDTSSTAAIRSPTPTPATHAASLTALIEGFFYDSLKSNDALKHLGRVKLVLAPPSAYLIGAGVARCQMHAEVRGPDGSSLVDEDFPGISHSSEPIEDADLIEAACTDAVKKIVARLGG